MKKTKTKKKVTPKSRADARAKSKAKAMAKIPRKPLEPKCKNCLLFNQAKGECKVAILVDGKEYHMPVFPEDRCHMDELGIPVEQVRWFVTDPKTGKPTKGNGIVQMEYPEGFFGKKTEEDEEEGDDLLADDL